MKGFFFSILLVLLVSVQTNPEGLLGCYELVLENHSKQTINIQKVNTYEEVEHRWRGGKWVLKCRYVGKWSVVGDTLILRPIKVVWADKHITECRSEDDPEQPGSCFVSNYFYDDKSIWNFGPISKTKFVHKKIQTERNK